MSKLFQQENLKQFLIRTASGRLQLLPAQIQIANNVNSKDMAVFNLLSDLHVYSN